jgi:hypothetical protein
VYYPLEELRIEIISDIDDTILHSFTDSFFKRVSAILFTPPAATASGRIYEAFIIHGKGNRDKSVLRIKK